MIRARKTSRWLLVLAFTMRLSSLYWLAVTSIGTGAGMIGTLPKALHYTISFMGHDTSHLPGSVQHVICVPTVTKVQSDRDLCPLPSGCVIHKALSLPTRSMARRPPLCLLI